jgi:hypothetical protein
MYFVAAIIATFDLSQRNKICLVGDFTSEVDSFTLFGRHRPGRAVRPLLDTFITIGQNIETALVHLKSDDGSTEEGGAY